MVVIIGSNAPLGPCSNQPNGLLINNVENCAAYWRCQDGIEIPEQCEPGHSFHEPSQSCVTQDVYECSDDGIGTTPGLTTTVAPTTENDVDFPEVAPICDGLRDGHFVNSIANCRSFYVCMNGFAIIAQCPDGYNFNELQQACSNHIDYPCFDEEVNNQLCPETGIYAYEVRNSCELFNFCYAGAHSIRTCAEGLQFNSIDRRCDFPAAADCYRDLAYDCPALNDPNNIVTYTSPTGCDG